MPFNQSYGMFGLPKRPIGTGGVFNGQFDDEPYAQQQPMQQKQEGGGFKRVAGIIGDALLASAGQSPIYTPIMERRRAEQRAMDYQQKMYEQQRQAKMADAMALYKFQQDNKAPPKPPAIQQNAEYIRATRGDEAANDYLDNYGRGPVQPNVVTIPGLGTFYGTPEEVTAAISAARGGGVDPVEAEMRRRGLM